ncbi:protein yellow, partial [Cephus cinctus]
MLKLVTIFVVLVAATLAVHDKFRVEFQWKYINVTWPSEDARLAALQNEEYIPENNAIAGIKLWKHRMYLTVPRWKNGVPVTLGVTSATPQNNVTAPNLEPYPNWEMQKVGNCKAFQFVQSMEID